jgi:hypothetical protein
MLSSGFATVTYLRSRLMPQEAAGETEWDESVAALGLSVAGKFDRHCNRFFTRAVGTVDQFSARASAWVLRRSPVEAISSVVLRAPDNSLQAIAAGDWWLDKAAGILESDVSTSDRRQQIEITYTGGYWLDPRDGTALPAGATALPYDVLEAWVLQCQHEAESRGLFHTVSFRTQKDASAPKTATAGLLDGVLETLRPYRRYSGE